MSLKCLIPKSVTHGGGISCATMRLKRDKGPAIDEIKK